MTAVLSASSLDLGYGPLPVTHDINVEVGAGEVIALLGANGAGKTTTLLGLAGELKPLRGQVEMLGRTVTSLPLHKRARMGLSYVTEERSTFAGLTLRDNLRAASVSIADALAIFPELEPRLGVRAGLLSGGEQQMLTLARAIARKPRVLLADELSLGLAPLVVRRLLDAVRVAATEYGAGVLLVEQHARKALHYTDRGYVMRRGRIVLEGSGAELRNQLDEIERHYLSGAAEDSDPRS